VLYKFDDCSCNRSRDMVGAQPKKVNSSRDLTTSHSGRFVVRGLAVATINQFVKFEVSMATRYEERGQKMWKMEWFLAFKHHNFNLSKYIPTVNPKKVNQIISPQLNSHVISYINISALTQFKYKAKTILGKLFTPMCLCHQAV